MNVALCLYGHVGISSAASGRTENEITKEAQDASTNPVIAAHGFHNNLFSKYNTATFIHTWSKEHEQLLNDLYSPQKAIFEEQIDFSGRLSDYGIESSDMSEWKVSEDAKKGYDLLLPSRETVGAIQTEMEREIFRTRSRWYSTQKAIELKSNFENEHKRKFDFVIVSRLDCQFGIPLFLQDKHQDKLYASFRHGRPDIDIALFDFYFMGGSEIIDKFGTLYNNCEDYCIRPTIACREHVKKVIGDHNLKDYLVYGRDYRKVT